MPERPAKRPKSWAKRLLLAAVIIAATPAALTAVASTTAVRAYFGREAAHVLGTELGMQASIGDVKVDWKHFAVVVSDIDIAHPEEGPLVRAAALRIEPSWWAIVRGQLDLHGVTIERADVWLKVRDDKVVNLPALPASEQPTSDIELPFDWLQIEHSRLVVDAAPWGNGEIQRIDLRLAQASDGALEVTLASPAAFANHATGTERLTQIALAARFAGKHIEISNLALRGETANLHLQDAELTLPLGTQYAGTLSLDVDIPRLVALPHGWELPRLEGQLSVQAEVQGDARGPSGDAKVHLRHGLVKQYGLGEDLRLSVLFDRDRIRWDGVAELIRDGGAVALRGELGLGKGLPLQLEADVRDVDFSKLMEQLEVSPNAIVAWTLAGGFDLQGTCDPLDLRGKLDMPTREFRVTRDAWHAEVTRPVIQVQRAHLVGQVRVRPAGIFLEQVDIALPASRLFVDRVLLGFDNELEIHAQALDWTLADSSPLLTFPLGGRGTFTLDVTGTFSDPVIAGQVAARDFTFNGYRFGDIVTEFTVDEDLMGVRFVSLEATKQDSRYRLRDGFLDFRDDRFRTGAQVEIARMTLADFYHVFHWEQDERYEPYTGEVEGTVGVDYTLGFPDDSANGTMIADIDLAVPKASIHGYAMRDGHVRGRWTWRDHALGYRGGELSIERAAMRKGDGTVSLSGKMALGGALDLVLLGDRISLRDIEGVGDSVPDLRGRVGVTANVKGTLANPRADIDLTTTGLTYQAEPLGDGRAYVRLTDKSDPWIAEALKWPEGAPPEDAACGHGREGLARGVWPEDPPLKTNEGLLPALDQPMAWVICGDLLNGQLQADVAVGRTKAYPLRGRLHMNALKFGRLLPREEGTVQRGTVTGEAIVRGGALGTPETLVGRVSIQELVVGQLDVDLHNDGPIAVTFDRGRFDIERAQLVGPSSELYLRGSGSLDQGLALSVNGHLDLSLFTAMAKDINAAGQIDLEFKVTGRMDRPQVYGSATLREGLLRTTGLYAPLEHVRGDVTFSAHRIVLENFHADVGGGRVSLAGVASLRGPRIGSYDLQLEGSGVSLALVDGLALRLGGRGTLGWKHGDRLPKLAGTLHIEELAYTRPVKMARAFDDLYGGGRASVESYDPEEDRLALDITVTHTEPLLLRNNLIDAELAIDDAKTPFRLVGTDQRYGLVGDMSVRKGTVRFRGKEFDVRSGEIRFDDETRIDPRFDVSATTEVRRQHDQSSWRVQIHTWGSREAFQFQLSSDPALAEDDIALLLTVGMTHSELAQVEAGQLTSTAALEALATVTGVEGEVQKAVPEIDEIQIASAYSEHSNRTEPQVFVGKRIAKRVRLSAATGIAESRDFSTGVELELSDKTSVEAVYNNQNATSASQLGDVGVDLKWRLEFD